MQLADFELERAAFELRHAPAYLLWDKAGTIWSEGLRRWPNLRMVRAEPSTTSFTLDKQNELSVTLEKSNVVSHFPAINTFILLADTFTGLVTHHLELKHYTRVGLRLFYFRSFASKQDASDAVLRTGILNLKGGLHFGIEGTYLLPEYTFRLEGPSTGVTIRLRAEGRVYDFDPPGGVREIQSHHSEKWGVLFDVDYYTLATVSIGQFRAEDWITHAIHLVRRDAGAFLRG